MEKIYAIIKNSTVVDTLIFEDPTENLLSLFKEDLDADHMVDITDNMFCGIGYTWDGTTFVRPQPFLSWIFDEESNDWIPPVPYPSDLYSVDPYIWNEDIQNWEQKII